MGQRSRELTQVFGYSGWVVQEMFFEDVQGRRVVPLAGYDVPQDVRVVLRVRRRWTARCARCGAICGRVHEQLDARRWKDGSSPKGGLRDFNDLRCVDLWGAASWCVVRAAPVTPVTGRDGE